jgi:hypothetical protein
MEGDGLANQLHGEVIATDLMSDDAEQVQRFRVLGLGGEDLAVERFGVRQPPALVVLNRKLKCRWNRHWGD